MTECVLNVKASKCQLASFRAWEEIKKDAEPKAEEMAA